MKDSLAVNHDKLEVWNLESVHIVCGEIKNVTIENLEVFYVPIV